MYRLGHSRRVQPDLYQRGAKSLTATYTGNSTFYSSVSAAATYTATDNVLVYSPLIGR